MPDRQLRDFMINMGQIDGKPVGIASMDGSDTLRPAPKVIEAWAHTAHAQSGVNCSGCHQVRDKAGTSAWIRQPDHKVCARCHKEETEGFLSGLHGMRLRQDMSPMQAGMAQQPMKPAAAHSQLTCVSCHGAHRFDTRHAAVEACLTCHNDTHTTAYKASSHFRLWQSEVSGRGTQGSGVSCASCHMPRIEFTTPEDESRILVQHNQNDNLRPNEKMVRSVCLNCHGLQFSLDALADDTLIARNFRGLPARPVDSIRMALESERRAALRKASKHDAATEQ